MNSPTSCFSFSTFAAFLCVGLLAGPRLAQAQQAIDLTLNAPTHYYSDMPPFGTSVSDEWRVESSDAPSTPRIDFSAGSTVVTLHFPEGIAIPGGGAQIGVQCGWITNSICSSGLSGTASATAVGDTGGFMFGAGSMQIGGGCSPDIDLTADVRGTTVAGMKLSAIELTIDASPTTGESGTFNYCYVAVSATLSSGTSDPGPLWESTCGDGMLFAATEQCDGEACCTLECTWDAACLDAGAGDAGSDAGVDAGASDAAAPDAGAPDAGAPDAATADAGAGAPDAATADAGGGGSTSSSGGCSCSVVSARNTAAGAIFPFGLLLLGLAIQRRRRG